jgi:hypothetical protein
MIRSRKDIAFANRVVIKAGTSVVSTPDGYPSLSRMASIVEHAAKLVQEGREVLIVTSGAVGVGRQRLAKQAVLRRTMNDLIANKEYVSHFDEAREVIHFVFFLIFSQLFLNKCTEGICFL